MRPGLPIVLLLCFLLSACGADTPGPGSPTYRQLGDLNVTAWAGAVAPDGDLVVGAAGRLYRWQTGPRTWATVPRDGLPEAQLFSIGVSGTGDYVAQTTDSTAGLYLLPAGHARWQAVSLPDPASRLNMARLGADGSLYVVSEVRQGQGTVSRIDKRSASGGAWTPVYSSQPSGLTVYEIKFVYPNGDLWVDGPNLQGKYVLRSGQGALEAGFDCSGNLLRPYCEDNPNAGVAFAPNGDLAVSFGGLGSRTVYQARGQGFPLRPQAVGTLPEGALQLGLVALNDGTLVGFGNAANFSNSLFRLRPGAAKWEELAERPYYPAFVMMLGNAKGQVFFFGRQCCFAPLPVAELIR